MAQPGQTVQNNFKAGLKTEYTGLNFPEDAATDTQNCVFSYVGDVTRRGGLNYEQNFLLGNLGASPQGVARSTYRWLNAGGDGTSQILVVQMGQYLFFYLSSSATISAPLSQNQILVAINITTFQAQGNTANPALVECQYSSGNGYLFVFHPDCDPFYCTYLTPGSKAPGSLIATKITLQIRDIIGIFEPGVADNYRPNGLTPEHLYNLTNQGWTQGSGWTGTSQINTNAIPLSIISNVTTPGTNITFPILSQSNTTTITNGSSIQMVISPCAGTGPNSPGDPNGSVTLVAVVSNYVTPFTSITVNVVSNNAQNLNSTGFWSGGSFTQQTANVQMSLISVGFISAWQSAIGNYPSNADVWWLYKNTSNVFSPSTTFQNVQAQNDSAPKGSYIINPFIQDRASVSSIGSLTAVSTTNRPGTGAFYQGRVWYAGINGSQQASGDEQYYTWSENIYFSQIIESPSTTNFGKCYQANDPTSQNLFALLSSDGGVINIPGCGNIYRLFPLRFGLLVFAANGIWFISGNSGIGFTADDFSVTKISNIQAISGTSFIEVQGFPFFWNQEGIYQVTPSAQAGSAHSPDIQLSVENLTIGTILSYYNDIPLLSKSYARGDYDMLNYIVQWCFKSTNETGISDRYNYDTILCLNMITKSFYPYTLPNNSASVISDVKYIQNPGGNNNPDPIFKYFTVNGSNITFSEENDFTNYVDFINENNIGYNYNSYFITGYSLPGQALRKIQVPYVYLFSRNPINSSLSIQAIWDYAGSAILGTTDMNSGKWSTRQTIYFNQTDYAMAYRKIRLRGRGMAVQIRISSIQGQPFDIMGWSVLDQVNQVA